MKVFNIKNSNNITYLPDDFSTSLDSNIVSTVTEIINNVKQNKDAALIEYTEKFDKTKLNNILVSEKEIEYACEFVDDKFKNIIDRIINNIEKYQKHTFNKSWTTIENDGTVLGEISNPINKTGLYIPGGTAPLISTVLMSAIPAYLAGVNEIVMCTPPDKNGNVNPYILYTAKKCQVNKIFKIGGAQSIAALAYGTETVTKVDKIVGPGNIYVTVAKKLVYGDVDIDMLAGPSEILVFADESINPDYIINDLLSQAEHDTLAHSILVTDSQNIVNHIKNNLDDAVNNLQRKDIINKSLEDNLIIYKVDNLETGVDIINKIAPEHLEVCVENPVYYIKKIKNAGAVFVGNYTPEPVGDYFAGPSHILPTSGTAKFYSPVSASTFIKKSSLIWYSKNKFLDSAKDIMRIAELEQLSAHKNSVKIRLDNEN